MFLIMKYLILSTVSLALIVALYDLVINTGRISIQTAIQLVVLTQVQRIVPDVQAPRK